MAKLKISVVDDNNATTDWWNNFVMDNWKRWDFEKQTRMLPWSQFLEQELIESGAAFNSKSLEVSFEKEVDATLFLLKWS